MRANPSSFRIASTSFALSLVAKKARSGPSSCAQLAVAAAARPAVAVGWSGVLHRSGLESPVPRGSNVTSVNPGKTFDQ